MDNVEERVAGLEGHVEEQSMRIDDVRRAVVSLEDRVGRFDDRVDRRFDRLELRMDTRFVGVDDRLDSMNKLLWGLIVSVTGGALAVIAGIVTALLQK